MFKIDKFLNLSTNTFDNSESYSNSKFLDLVFPNNDIKIGEENDELAGRRLMSEKLETAEKIKQNASDFRLSIPDFIAKYL